MNVTLDSYLGFTLHPLIDPTKPVCGPGPNAIQSQRIWRADSRKYHKLSQVTFLSMGPFQAIWNP